MTILVLYCQKKEKKRKEKKRKEKKRKEKKRKEKKRKEKKRKEKKRKEKKRKGGVGPGRARPTMASNTASALACAILASMRAKGSPSRRFSRLSLTTRRRRSTLRHSLAASAAAPASSGTRASAACARGRCLGPRRCLRGGAGRACAEWCERYASLRLSRQTLQDTGTATSPADKRLCGRQLRAHEPAAGLAAET